MKRCFDSTYITRKKNLDRLLLHIGSQRELADICGINKGQISHHVNGKRIGEKVAATLESAVHLPKYWLDAPSELSIQEQVDEVAAATQHPIYAAMSELLVWFESEGIEPTAGDLIAGAKLISEGAVHDE